MFPRPCRTDRSLESDPRLAGTKYSCDTSCWTAAQPTGIDDRLRSMRSEEHTSELQSHVNLVCRLLLEKKKTHTILHPRLVSFLLVSSPLQRIFLGARRSYSTSSIIHRSLPGPMYNQTFFASLTSPIPA